MYCNHVLQLWNRESVVQAERTACTMDHENKPEHEVQFSWMSSWSDVRMQKHLLLRDWDTIARFYADKAVGLGKGASYSSVPPCGASQKLTVSLLGSALISEKKGFNHPLVWPVLDRQVQFRCSGVRKSIVAIHSLTRISTFFFCEFKLHPPKFSLSLSSTILSIS